jgi:bifunctional enzyme CysN/CysC
MPVQWVNRPNLDFRGFSGQIASGTVKPGDRIKVLPSGKESTVARIVTMPTAISTKPPGQSVTLTLEDEIDISRGPRHAPPNEIRPKSPTSSRSASCLDGRRADPSGPALSDEDRHNRRSPRRSRARNTGIDVNTLAHEAAQDAGSQRASACATSRSKAIPFDPYDDNRRPAASS